MANQRLLQIEMEFTAKPYDVDYFGIVHNVVYIRWLEDLRLQLMGSHYPLEEMMAAGLSPVLERTEITYRRPVRLLTSPLGQMWISKITRARWTVQAEFTHDEQLIASAEQSGYIVDLERLRPVRIPERLLAPWLAARESSA